MFTYLITICGKYCYWFTYSGQGNWGRERLNKLSEVTQLAGCGFGVQTWKAGSRIGLLTTILQCLLPLFWKQTSNVLRNTLDISYMRMFLMMPFSVGQEKTQSLFSSGAAIPLGPKEAVHTCGFLTDGQIFGIFRVSRKLGGLKPFQLFHEYYFPSTRSGTRWMAEVGIILWGASEEQL